MLKRILRSRRGEGYIDVCVLVLCAMLVIALAVQVLSLIHICAGPHGTAGSEDGYVTH